MPWIRIWVHLVFSTKNRELMLNDSIRYKVFKHIKENARDKDIFLDSINGYRDHAHCLVSLGAEQSISKVTKLIKGESSNWINKTLEPDQKFIWQNDYWAVSVSESHLENVRKYIHNQEKHHQQVDFSNEITLFEKKYGWKKYTG